jgi:hypothetical protein
LIIPNLTVLKLVLSITVFLTFLKVIEIPACSKNKTSSNGAGLNYGLNIFFKKSKIIPVGLYHPEF